MDPTKTLAELLAALDALSVAETGAGPEYVHRDAAIASLESLTNWLKRHGFAPAVSDAIAGSGVEL